MGEKPTIFLRTATGLVKPWATWDGFIYNVLAIQPMVVLAFGFVNGLAIAPAGNMYLALILSGIFCTALAYVEASLISAMPRSGGDYIFQSRILGGATGFINLFVFVVIMQIIWLAFPAWWAADHVVAPFFVIFGAMWGNQALIDSGIWMSTGNGFFVLGIIVVSWSSIINYVGMVWYRRAQKACFYVGIVGMVIMIGMLLTTSSGAFQPAFDRFMMDIFHLGPGSYNSIMELAKAEGFSTAGNVGYESLIIAIPLAMAFMFPAWSAFNAGEIKGAGGLKAQMIQVVLAEIVCIILALLLYASISHTIPVDWYKSITWLFWNTDVYPIPVAPYFGFLVAMIYENPIPMLIIFITLQAWFWMWFVNITLAVSRTMLAMSFDRVFPEKLAAVHPRTRAPWVAIIVIMVIAWIFVGLFAYTPFDQLILAAPLVSIVGFAGTALAGMVMPWRRKELYKASPISKHEIGGIPTISIAGAIWIIFTIAVLILFARETRLFFVEGWIAWVYLIGMYVLGAIIYFGYKAKRKAQGIDVELAYKEIPVE